jgi:hypothetical protein
MNHDRPASLKVGNTAREWPTRPRPARHLLPEVAGVLRQ